MHKAVSFVDLQYAFTKDLTKIISCMIILLYVMSDVTADSGLMFITCSLVLVLFDFSLCLQAMGVFEVQVYRCNLLMGCSFVSNGWCANSVCMYVPVCLHACIHACTHAHTYACTSLKSNACIHAYRAHIHE